MVEQHKDDVNRGHVYILSTKPFPTKASDKGKPDTANKIANNEVPGIEVKGVGSLSFAWNSVHQGGRRYEFVNGMENPVLCNEFPAHIDRICRKYGLDYLDEHGMGKGDIPITELFKAETVIYEGNNRHKEQLRINDSLISRNKGILPLVKIRQLAMEWNQAHCRSPLDDKEFDKLFNQSVRFVLKNNGEALVSEIKSIFSYLSKISTICLNLVHGPQSASYAKMYLDENPVCHISTPDKQYWVVLHKSLDCQREEI